MKPALRLSLNEGSLLRRTVLHVVAFVLGTAAFLALASFLLVTILKSALDPSAPDSSSGDGSGEEATSTGAPSANAKPRPPRKKRGAPLAAPTPAPAADDDE
jgi:hypothetical protein